MSRDYDYLRSAEFKEQRQRERLCTAFVQALSDHGYRATTVARVAEISGCSQETFHRYYEDLDDLFRDTCSQALQESRSATVAAWLAVHGWSERLRRSVEALLHHVEDHPRAARAVLVTSLTGGIEVAEHVRETVAFHERALVTAFQLHPRGFPTSRLTPRALTGGIRHVLYLKMRAGREPRLAPLADDLHEWIECHRAVAASRFPLVQRERCRGARGSIARGREPASRILAQEDERARVLDTLVQLMLQPDRDRLDDATVARHAGISAARFSGDYGGVSDCLAQILDGHIEEADAALRAGAARGESWPESVRLAVLECVRRLASNPRLTQLALLRLSLVPEVAEARHAALARRIVSCALEQAPFPRYGSSFVADALVGAVGELLAWAAAGDMLDALPALADHIAFFLLAPYLGGEQAAEAVTDSAARERLGRG